MQMWNTTDKPSMQQEREREREGERDRERDRERERHDDSNHRIHTWGKDI